MQRRTDRRAYLALQWDGGAWEDAPLWIDTLGSRLPGARVHWILPAFADGLPARRRAAVARALRARLEDAGDAVGAMGFAGACHPVLGLDDLDRELAWGVRNPWGTGLADVLGATPRILVPSLADLARPEAAALYRRHGFTAVGVCIDAAAAPGWPAREAPAPWFPVLRLRVATEDAESPAWKLARRLAGTANDLFLLLDVTGAAPARLAEALGDLGSRIAGPAATRALLEPAGTTSEPPSPPGWLPDWSPFPVACLRSRLEATAAIARRKRRRTEETRELLQSLRSSADGEPAAVNRAAAGSGSARLVAHMLGEVMLAGPRFDVRVAGGRFCGLARQGRDLLPRVPAVSTLRVDGRAAGFRTESSFSFEGEDGTGLREQLSLEGNPGAGLALEYSFRDDCAELSISGEMVFPPLSDAVTVDDYAPLSLALRALGRGEAAVVDARGPDGSCSRVTVPGDGRPVTVPGAEHRVALPSGGVVVLRAPGPPLPGWTLPSFRVVRRRGRRLLVANPFGSDAAFPGRLAAGRRERFAILLGVDDA